jgi:hypothetical protein
METNTVGREFIVPAKIFTQIFSPFYAPVWAILWLLVFSNYRHIPLRPKIFILLVVVVFTVIVPKVMIFLLRRKLNLSRWQFDMRSNRHLQYAIAFLCSLTCVLFLMRRWNAFPFLSGVVVSALVAEVVCLVINIWWKISVHMVGIGGLAGLVTAFSHRFVFDPVLPICVFILLGGLMGTSQMLLRQHTLLQLIVGFFVGMLCARLTFLFW